VNVKNNGLTRAGSADHWRSVRGGDSQHSCGEGECSDENGYIFEVHIASVIKMKEVCSVRLLVICFQGLNKAAYKTISSFPSQKFQT
jgi:hypothetical protein